MPFLNEKRYDVSAKEDEVYADFSYNHRHMCGGNAVVVCLYFDEGR